MTALCGMTTPASWTPAPSALCRGLSPGAGCGASGYGAGDAFPQGPHRRAGPGAGRRQGRHVCNNLSAAAQRAGAGAGRGQRTAEGARNALRCVQLYTKALQSHSDRIERFCCIPGTETVTLQLTPELKMDILCGEPALYRRQKEVYDAAYAGERNGYDLIRWAKSMNVCSLQPAALLPWPGNRFGRRCLRPCVGNGESDALRYSEGAASWVPCLHLPEAAGASAAENGGGDGSGPAADERPHPYVISLLPTVCGNLYFTDAVDIPGLVEPQFHEAVHLEVE